ncbi:hypothetical protein PUNSTDRAFT_147021 [Punctularia strigosozonata HHB-11173 SS5]|uniref:Uncharacterized protein n=1 Tax=Punctularia strigosozonata (strain HHB-11173) TaxID=741275 RepID=R7S2W4_PUNST|nr:uncharacterized protein PUNSTDRAFT_147021 [Punctularia strigosozonata HHB-11173 SS5]EIN03591.1 hypothetical protein PUNSTDRAFT_147021 [Punctularia strigosozonata HHB-11173 SS5]
MKHRMRQLAPSTRWKWAYFSVGALSTLFFIHAHSDLPLHAISALPRPFGFHKPVILGPTLNDLEAGTWTKRDPPLDLEHFWNGDYTWVESAGQEGEGLEGEALQTARRERAERLASWEWAGPGAVADLDAEWMLVRALRSPGGIILVGDSIQLQLFEHLVKCIPRTVPHETVKSQSEVHYRVPLDEPHMVDGSYAVFLSSSDSSVVLDLLRAANAPLERLSRPVITFVREDLLLTIESASELVGEVMGEVDGQHRLNNVVFGNWTDVLAANSLPIRTQGTGRDWSGDRKNVVLLNSGAHWSPGCFHDLGEESLWQTYSAMVHEVVSTLSALPATTLLYRPTIPGHASCASFLGPVSSPDELVPLTFDGDWGWTLFPSFNELWVNVLRGGITGPHISEDRDAPSMGPKPPGYLPVYTRSLLRPDAHRIVGNDCLHLAGPGVTHEWAKWAMQEIGALDNGMDRAHIFLHGAS